jgi:hypothetical protein
MDTAILTWIHGYSRPALDSVFRFSNELGTLPFCASLVVLMALWHVARKERRGAPPSPGWSWASQRRGLSTC